MNSPASRAAPLRTCHAQRRGSPTVARHSPGISQARLFGPVHAQQLREGPRVRSRLPPATSRANFELGGGGGSLPGRLEKRGLLRSLRFLGGGSRPDIRRRAGRPVAIATATLGYRDCRYAAAVPRESARRSAFKRPPRRSRGAGQILSTPGAVSRRDNAAMGPNSASPSPRPRPDGYGPERRDARGLFVRLFLPG
jgi:hypothetical protein